MGVLLVLLAVACRSESEEASAPLVTPTEATSRQRALGLLSRRAPRPAARLFRGLFAERQSLSFASGSRLAELDGEETFGDYLRCIGAPQSLRTTLRGFLEMTMGDSEASGAAYTRTYLAEMVVRADRLRVPERGAGAAPRRWPPRARMPLASRRRSSALLELRCPKTTRGPHTWTERGDHRNQVRWPPFLLPAWRHAAAGFASRSRSSAHSKSEMDAGAGLPL